MTVGSQVKNCFSSIKAIEATLEILENKTQKEEAKQTFSHTKKLVKEIKSDLQQQVIFLAKEEPQYK